MVVKFRLVPTVCDGNGNDFQRGSSRFASGINCMHKV